MSLPHEPVPVRRLAPDRPLVWIIQGWRDFRAAPVLGMAHGAMFLAGGVAIALIGWGRFDLLAGAFSGFLLVAPLLLAGLYAISRDREAGVPPGRASVTRSGGCASRPSASAQTVGPRENSASNRPAASGSDARRAPMARSRATSSSGSSR